MVDASVAKQEGFKGDEVSPFPSAGKSSTAKHKVYFFPEGKRIPHGKFASHRKYHIAPEVSTSNVGCLQQRVGNLVIHLSCDNRE